MQFVNRSANKTSQLEPGRLLNYGIITSTNIFSTEQSSQIIH